jgi:aspartyl-tRNA(Asn)/glutamyl-tRNA(Gln) amidotransferase subunit C
MNFNEAIVDRVAQLARLDLNKSEKKEMIDQLSEIISYVDKINELDTENIEAASHVIDQHNIMRDDIPGQSINRQKIENGAPDFKNGHFSVPKIIDEK